MDTLLDGMQQKAALQHNTKQAAAPTAAPQAVEQPAPIPLELAAMARDLDESHKSTLTELEQVAAMRRSIMKRVSDERNLLDRKIGMMRFQRRRLWKSIPILERLSFRF